MLALNEQKKKSLHELSCREADFFFLNEANGFQWNRLKWKTLDIVKERYEKAAHGGEGRENETKREASG